MSDLSPQDIADEMFQSFADFWAARTQVEFPNTLFNPAEVPAGEDYVSLYILGDTDGTKQYSHSVARNNFEEKAALTVTGYGRKNSGTSGVYALLHAVKEWMEQPQLLANAMIYKVGSPIELVPTDAWFPVSVTGNFRYFRDRAAA